MRRPLRLDMTQGYEQHESMELTVKLRVPVAPGADDQVGYRVSIDHQLEQIRQQLRSGQAGKVDEDNLVIFRLLQALGFEYWPIEEQDL